MASLERNLRKDLERTVKKARNVAEAGARQAIAQLGVGEPEAPKHLTAEQRALRNGLRAHGRQLGDRRDPKTGAQVTVRLAQECAYEHWHRMLFARFLAETDLLIEPESGVAITLDEVQELAREKGVDWLPLASDYAERMLPQIFRKDDPVLDIALPPETRSELEDLLKALPKAVFEADDSLGWVYQFWQAEKKEEVNKSEVKIGADELPAVTQLFTEDYMVLFLLHNTLGAWWAGKVLAAKPSLAASAPDEAALRTACKVGDFDWTYLRFVRDTPEDGTEGPWRPAAGVFDGWPKAAKELTVLDPCMGSGHFLVFALPLLVAFRMSEEALSQSAAVDAVLRDNLFGLEIDPRCTQIAAFNLAFAAWKRTGFHVLPQLNLACSGLAIGVTKAEWLKLAEKAVIAADPAAKRDLLGVEKNLLTVGLEERVKNGLEALYDLFTKAPWLGSLIDPRHAGGDIFREGFDKLEPLIASLLNAADTDDAREMAVAAQGMAKAAELMVQRFILIATNVPFLGRGKQDEVLQNYLSQYYADAKADLATAMLRRLSVFASPGGTCSAVTPQNWLFLGSYKKLREFLLKATTLKNVVVVGEHGFESPAAAGAFTALVTYTVAEPREDSRFRGFDLHDAGDPSTKANVLLNGQPLELQQVDQLRGPDHIIKVSKSETTQYLGDYADTWKGIVASDNGRFTRDFFEIAAISGPWKPLFGPPTKKSGFTGYDQVIYWQDGHGDLHKKSNATNFPPSKVLTSSGIVLSQMRTVRATLFGGGIVNDGAVPLIPKRDEYLPAIYAFFTDESANRIIRTITRKVIVGCGYFKKVPFDLTYWQEVASTKFPDGLPDPYSDDPTQWLFHGHPADTPTAVALQVTALRLLGYRWPAESDPEMLLSTEARSWVRRSASLNESYPSVADGIVCLTAIKGEPPAEQRLNALLAAAFGADWSASKLAGLLAEAGYAGKSLDDWLRDGFFAQHTELFHQRPFIWHIWDGRRDGFHALVNYHRLAAPDGEGRRILEKLIYSYLGDWIDRQHAEQKAGVEGADARLAHAQHLRAELIKILEGEPPYDIFVRWKPLHEQPIGWDPDINDGVRMNIRPFMMARPLGAKANGICILRATPKIKWDKDRGKEPGRDKADYPWFWGWDQASADFVGGPTFDGNRWNDLHYSRSVKQATRDRRATKAGTKL